MASNFEAFECDVAHVRFLATANELHGMFPPLLSPPPPSSLPPAPRQKEGTFHYRNISGEEIILHHSFFLIQKNQRRVKLQIFRINLKL